MNLSPFRCFFLIVLFGMLPFTRGYGGERIQQQDTLTISESTISNLIIAYEESSQELREIEHSLLVDFRLEEISEGYRALSSDLEKYYRIDGQGLKESSLSRVNDLIIIFERRNNQLGIWQEKLTEMAGKLSDYKISITKTKQRLRVDPGSLTKRALAYYQNRFGDVISDADSIDSVVDSRLEDVLLLELKISKDYAYTFNRIEDLKLYVRNYWENVVLPEDVSWNFKWSEVKPEKTADAFTDTLWRIGNFFITNASHSFLLILLGLCFYFAIRRIYQTEKEIGEEELRHPMLYTSPVALALLFSGFVFPVVYPPTTTLMYDFVVLITYLPFLFILYNRMDRSVFRRYFLFFLAFLTLKLQNLLLPLSGYSSIILTACALIFVYIVLANTIRTYLSIRWRWTRIFNWMLGILAIAGILLIIFKRITLGRLLINGVGETIAIALILIFLGAWFDSLISFLKNRPYFQRLSSDRAKIEDFWYTWSNRIYTILLILFLIALLRSFNVYADIKDAFLEMWNKERVLGELTFTFGGIILFALVIYLSSRISAGIKFFSEDKSFYKNQKKTANLAVILRFFVVTLGFLLALAVSGIPLDKIAIILGALSVGIGFGLQNIVNNLISGLILIFERPIQSGDIVEVQQYMGIVKDIGIRSSVIKTFDGSEIIVPNGDLISQAVTNWTLSNKHRRVEVRVGVAYGSSVEKTNEVLSAVVANHDRILKLPKPLILFDGLGNSSVDFRMLFWTSDIDNWLATKSDILTAVYNGLADAGIEIPFPQRDLHIRSWDPKAGPPGAAPPKESEDAGAKRRKKGQSDSPQTTDPKSEKE